MQVPTWHALFLRAGQPLHVGPRRSGARAYLAIDGGIAVPRFLGSRSTYLPGGFGGLEGRRLRANERLPLGTGVRAPAMRAGRSWPQDRRPPYTSTPTLRVVLGPQDDAFTARGLDTFLNSAYVLTPASNRMGARLKGAPIAHRDATGIVSDGVVTGSVQVPADGQPIVMLADHQTTGGYPKIATVIRADLPLLAQLLPGERVRFKTISIIDARELLIKHDLL
jgi:antagonist of KipI